MNRVAQISGFVQQQSKNIQTELLIEPFHSFFSFCVINYADKLLWFVCRIVQNATEHGEPHSVYACLR